MPAELAGAGTHIDDVVGGADGVLVVLDDDHGVALVAQALERVYEPVVVALVQADGGLVEDIEHAHEAGADLRGQTDALGLAARERGGRTRQREVVEADVDEEAQARDDLLDHGPGDEALAVAELERLEERERFFAGKVADLVDRFLAHGDGQDLGLQARAVAGVARDLADELLEMGAHGLGGGLLVLVEEHLAHAGEGGKPMSVAAVARTVVDADLCVAEAAEQNLLRLLWQLVPGGLVRDADVLARRGKDLRPVVRVAEEAAEDAARHAERRVLDQCLGVHDLAEAKAVAIGAGAVGSVEREVARLQVVHRVAMLGAGKRERILQKLARHALRVVAVGKEPEPHLALRELGGLLHALRDAAERVLAHDDAVDDDLDRVLDVLLELDLLVELADLAVHAHAAEALALEVLEELGVLALAAEDHGCEHEGAAALGVREDLIGHLVGGLALDHPAALGAVRRAHAREEQAQVVVDLGDGAHGGARVPGRGLLVDGDRRRKAVDGVEVGLVHLSQELARIAGEGLDVAALALGVAGVEGQARLARARKAGDDDELVARDVDVDVLQVMLARASDDDGFLGHIAPPNVI